MLASSHLLSEVSQSVDDIVVISHGQLRASGPLQQVLGQAEGGVTRVRAGDREGLTVDVHRSVAEGDTAARR